MNFFQAENRALRGANADLTEALEQKAKTDGVDESESASGAASVVQVTAKAHREFYQAAADFLFRNNVQTHTNCTYTWDHVTGHIDRMISNIRYQHKIWEEGEALARDHYQEFYRSAENHARTLPHLHTFFHMDEENEDDEPEEVRMLDIQNIAASVLECSPVEIKMHKELDVRSGNCNVFVTDVMFEEQMA